MMRRVAWQSQRRLSSQRWRPAARRRHRRRRPRRRRRWTRRVADLQPKSARFAPTDLTADITALPPNERDALAHMVRAAQVMDALFLEQVWAGNESDALQPDQGRIAGRQGAAARIPDQQGAVVAARSQRRRSCPARRRNRRRPTTIPKARPRRKSRSGSSRWAAPRRRSATGFFTTIRRGPDGGFVAVPYSIEYQGELAIAAQHLRAAAAATAQPTLKAFLESRAAAFVSNDYYDSDVKWMELDATIEPTIGPYEVYEDEWFNYKAAFEAFITVKDQTESDKLQQVCRLAAGDRKQPADRSEVPQSEARRAGADRRRQHRVLGRRRQSRRPDRGLQPAQRRARDPRKGQQARDAEEQPAGEVRQGAGADLEGGARVAAIRATSRSRRSSRTS